MKSKKRVLLTKMGKGEEMTSFGIMWPVPYSQDLKEEVMKADQVDS